MHWHQQLVHHAMFLGAVLLFVLSPVGCSESSTHGTIEGSVNLDGKPLAEGVVRFVPIDSALQTGSAPIVNGKFQVELLAGTYRMEFSAPQVTGTRKMYDTPDSPEVDIVTELLPERYNVRSELQITVQPGRNDLLQELTTNRE